MGTKVLVSLQNRDREEIATFTFDHDVAESFIQLTDRSGSTFSVLDPLTDRVNLILPTRSEVEVPQPPVLPDKSACKPGDVFPEDANVTAEDQVNSDGLEANGYVPETRGTWGAGQYITIGTFRFTVAGDVWAPGTGV